MKENFKKLNFNDYLTFILSGFFISFLIIYIGRYGLTNLVLTGGSKHENIFNISLWFVMVSYCIDKFSEVIDKWES